MAKIIYGNRNGRRIDTKTLDDEIREAIRQGDTELLVISDGQHGIGGRLCGITEPVTINVEGPVGQRLGGMGMLGTTIIVKGSASDDVGWLNCGANITVLGDVTNGAHNAAAQGILYVQGSGGARCDTMTKHNPKFEPPQSWYFRDVGDAFAEFKAGGIAVVCGVNPRNKYNIIGYHPCVGMVGGTIYFRGAIESYSENDVRLVELTQQDWDWLVRGMQSFLKAIDREDYYLELTRDPDDWKKLIPWTASERAERKGSSVTISQFRESIWEKDIGKDGIFKEYLDHPQTTLPYITTGNDRRFKPVWSNGKYLPPCEYSCPSGIPTWKRTQLIRSGKIKEALELVFQYSPLPATICGNICAHICMDNCTRSFIDKPLNTEELGKASLTLEAPKKEQNTGKKVAVIGSGAGGLSASWQLVLKGHEVHVFEAEKKLGGKLEYLIPRDRLPQKVLKHEIERISSLGIHLHLGVKVDASRFKEIYKNYDAVIIACGATKPKIPYIEGADSAITAFDFLKQVNAGRRLSFKDKNVVIVGAGNVGMDAASQAYRLGAKEVTAVDIQKPAAFGKELEIAESLGTKIIWPKSVKKFDKKGRRLYFTDGSTIETDILIISTGDVPVTDFLFNNIHTRKDGWIEADEAGRTNDPKVFAVGDAVSIGLATHAVGHGRKAAEAVHAFLTGRSYDKPVQKPIIPYERIKTSYYEARRSEPATLETESDRCLSCATCRDCHMCEVTCYYGAITRKEDKNGVFEYVVDDRLCIGCGFCAGVCPCGVWEMVENY